jgi:hypothetical protein
MKITEVTNGIHRRYKITIKGLKMLLWERFLLIPPIIIECIKYPCNDGRNAYYDAQEENDVCD